MTGLRDYFEEAAAPAPPSRLTADELYTTGRRRRRRRTALTAAVGCAAVLLAAPVAVFGLSRALPDREAGTDTSPAGTQRFTPGLLPHPEQRIQWSGAADGQHLYLSLSPVAPCAGVGTPRPGSAAGSVTCQKTLGQLVGSDDGGRTWTERGDRIAALGYGVLGPDRLLAVLAAGSSGTSAGPVAGRTLRASADGGRTWRALAEAPAVAAAPAGTSVVCRPTAEPNWTPGTPACELSVVDPAAGWIAPLSRVPDLLPAEHLVVQQMAGRLWLPGFDPATGRPAVAVSADAGRTWATTVFADAPECPAEGCHPPVLSAGTPAHLVVDGDRQRAGYRYRADGSGWQRLAGPGQVPYQPGASLSFVTGDGAHLICQRIQARAGDLDGCRFWSARQDGAYRPAELDGLPETVDRIQRTADGRYFAVSYGDGLLYGSADGWRWYPLTRR